VQKALVRRCAEADRDISFRHYTELRTTTLEPAPPCRNLQNLINFRLLQPVSVYRMVARQRDASVQLHCATWMIMGEV
jgi:hypothetical protein